MNKLKITCFNIKYQTILRMHEDEHSAFSIEHLEYIWYASTHPASTHNLLKDRREKKKFAKKQNEKT